MSASNPHETRFDGVRVRYDSAKSYDELVAALFDDIGETPVELDDLVKAPGSWQSYEQQVEPYVGPGGFMLFKLFDHGAWITKAGIDLKVLRIVLGNPLIAITMFASRCHGGFVRTRRGAARRRGRWQQPDLHQTVVADGLRTQPAIAQRRKGSRREVGRAGGECDSLAAPYGVPSQCLARGVPENFSSITREKDSNALRGRWFTTTCWV
jgi:hypothetical protein